MAQTILRTGGRQKNSTCNKQTAYEPSPAQGPGGDRSLGLSAWGCRCGGSPSCLTLSPCPSPSFPSSPCSPSSPSSDPSLPITHPTHTPRPADLLRVPAPSLCDHPPPQHPPALLSEHPALVFHVPCNFCVLLILKILTRKYVLSFL